MSTNVYTDGKALVTQYAAGTVSQSADPVLLKTQSAPGVAPHFNISTSINNPAGTVYDHNTEVAHSESYLGQGQHAPVVIVGRNTGMLNGDNGFLSWMKNVYIEKRNAVMHEVDTAVNSVWSKLAPGLQNAISNGEKIVSGMTPQDFGDAAQDDAKEMMDALMSKDTLIALGQTAVMMGIAAIPVVGEIADGAAAVQRIKSAVDSVQGASEELKGMVDRWSKPMTPEQLAAERKKLASWLIKVGISVILAALGKAVAKLSGRAKGKENSSKPVITSQQTPPPTTKLPCETCNPVIIATGEKTLTESDFYLPGTIPLDWTRRYRSGSTRDSWFGQGWSVPLAVELSLSSSELTYFDEGGRGVCLPAIAVGTEHFEAYEQFTLRRPDNDIWELVFKNGQIQVFKRVRADLFRLPLSDIADRNGNRIAIHYPPAPEDSFEPWRPQAIIDSGGRHLELTWDTLGHLTSVALNLAGKAPLLASYRYSDAGDLITHIDASGAERSYEWRNRLLVAYTQQDGARYCAQYDEYSPSGKVIRSFAAADGRELFFQYNDRARKTSITDSLGRTTCYEYDARRDIVATTRPDGERMETPFDTNGNLRGAKDPLGRKSHYRFDRRGNLLELVDAAGERTSFEYNDLDLPVKETDALKSVWQFAYDVNGNLVKIVDPLEQITRNVYDQRGLPIEIIDARGGVKHLQWDDYGNLASYTDCSNRTTRFTYNAIGLLQSRSDALGQTTQYRWDAAGNLVQVLEVTGAVHQYKWSKQGRLLAYIDPIGAITHYRYNSHGQPIERTDANGNKLQYTYDVVGRLVHLTNENGDVTHFMYDLADRLTDEIGFDGRHQRYCYNAVGELTHTVEAGGSDFGPGKVTRFERDMMGRLTVKHAEDDPQCHAEYQLDPLGRLIKAINPVCEVAFAYDQLGQLLSEKQTFTGKQSSVLTHSYDVLGNRSQSVLPDGRTLNWLFYGSGHLHQINIEENGEHRVIADIERDGLHREIARSQGKLQSQYEYDPMGRLSRHKASIANAGQRGGRVMQQAIERDYQYDLAGNLTSKLDTLRGSHIYRYDPIGRILSATGRQEELFAFDPAGNLQAVEHGRTPGMVPGNRIETYQDLRYTYDAHGNILTRDKGAHEKATLQWNADHQLREATVTRHGVTQSTQYEYDALGRRISKIDGFGRTTYLWDGDHMIQSERGKKSSLFVFELFSFTPLATIQDDSIYWYQCDHIGVPQELTDEEGTIVWAADSKVWGEMVVRKTGTDDLPARYDHNGIRIAPNLPQIEQPFRFQGQQFDVETGLHYNRFRYYDPGVGRFVSQDPVGFLGGDNFFLYAFNPMGWIDPLGLMGIRADLYPSRVRKKTRKALDKKATGPDGKMRCAKCNCVITATTASVQHDPPLVETHNTTGYNVDQPTRNNLYNSTASDLNCLPCQKSEGGTMSHTQNYRTDTGPNFKPRKPKKPRNDNNGC